jgi:outer membrane protein assembly factor BamD
MLNGRRGNGWTALALAVAWIVGAVGCATVDYRTLSAPEIFDVGEKYYGQSKWDQAKEAFDKLKEIHPFSVKVTPAELRIAEILYQKHQYAEAVTALDEFVTRHPTNDEVPRAVYYLGMANYNQMLSIDRDQNLTKEAERHFQRLVTQYPSNPFADKGKPKLAEVRLRLAKRERYVGRFYWKQGEYYAALGRFLGLGSDYADTPLADEGLYYAARCHLKLHDTAAAAKVLTDQLQRYPNGTFASQAKSLLGGLHVPTAP